MRYLRFAGQLSRKSKAHDMTLIGCRYCRMTRSGNCGFAMILGLARFPAQGYSAGSLQGSSCDAASFIEIRNLGFTGTRVLHQQIKWFRDSYRIFGLPESPSACSVRSHHFPRAAGRPPTRSHAPGMGGLRRGSSDSPAMTLGVPSNCVSGMNPDTLGRKDARTREVFGGFKAAPDTVVCRKVSPDR